MPLDPDPTDLALDAFHYDLSPEAIAQRPADDRASARLMVVPRGGEGGISEGVFADLPELVTGAELVVFNDTRVVPARLAGTKETGGAVELFVIGPTGRRAGVVCAEALCRASKPLRPGAVVSVGGAAIEIVEALGAGRFEIALPSGFDDLWGFLERHGLTPLPPYIRRPDGPGPRDRDRYQTVYARQPGAVAAPTAGLHFTPELLDRLRARGCDTAFLTLHVGLGTFQPVRVERVRDHHMHAERFEIPPATVDALRRARAGRRPVLAVGTTVVRALEGAAAAASDGFPAPGAATTDIFIVPPWRFRVVDQLITNFHLPGSTLIMLVSAFAGRERVLAAYRRAVERGFRFYSYGDGMLIR